MLLPDNVSRASGIGQLVLSKNRLIESKRPISIRIGQERYISMKKLVSLLGIAATLLFAGNSKVSAQMCVPWHNLTQAQRNQFILSAGVAQNGMYLRSVQFPGLPMQCKEWVQNVVYRASGGAVWLPSNYSNFEWNGHSWVYSLPGMSVQACQSGQIIQMEILGRNGQYGPHTAIVWQVYSSGIYFLDCNYGGDGRVQIHYLSFADYSKIVRRYTVYTVL